MYKSSTALALVTLLATLSLPTGDARADDKHKLATLQAAFKAYSGAELVFRKAGLPSGHYYDRMPELSGRQQVSAARIALREIEKYPRGYLGAMGLSKVGIFDALVANKGDGFRPYNQQWGGYLYYGVWNGADAVVAAYYTDGQLPLTLHHEVFHHVDGTRHGTTDYGRYFRADDAQFAKAIAGKRRYRAPAIDARDLSRLHKRADGAALRTTVSGYAAKGAGEDQAETARHLMTNLADALIQVVEHPEYEGSQRILHVLKQYARAVPDGPGIDFFVDVALERAGARGQDERDLRRAIDTQHAHVWRILQPTRNDTVFAIRGGEDKNGINWTLRADIDQIGRGATALARHAAKVSGSDAILGRALMKNLRIVARFHGYIDARWHVTKGTQATFDRARARIIAALPKRAHALAERLSSADYPTLANHINASGEPTGRLRARANQHLKKVDDAIADKRLRAVIRSVQPATVRIGGGSGVNIASHGLVLTAAHVVDRKRAHKTVVFPDGRTFKGTVTAIDHKLDLAVLELDKAQNLPYAALAPKAPKRGAKVVVIGQPGKRTPGGKSTGYAYWHVSVGKIRGFLRNRLGNQGLGRTKHDAWTYWGHSGSPLFDRTGRIVALHNSWDSTTAMRHAVTWEAIAKFVNEYRN